MIYIIFYPVHTCLLTCTDPRLHSVVVTLTPGALLKDRILRIRFRTQMLEAQEDTPSESDLCVLCGLLNPYVWMDHLYRYSTTIRYVPTFLSSAFLKVRTLRPALKTQIHSKQDHTQRGQIYVFYMVFHPYVWSGSPVPFFDSIRSSPLVPPDHS